MENRNITKEFWTAFEDKNLAKVRALLREDPSRLSMLTPMGTLLHSAVTEGSLPIVKLLVKMGIDVNRGSNEGANPTPIDTAALEGHLDIAKYLLDNGAKMDTSEPARNPLFSAIYGGHTEIARLLLDRGIDFRVRYNGKNMNNVDAMAFAKQWGRAEIVELLGVQKWLLEHPEGGRNSVKEFWDAMKSGAPAVKKLLREDPSRVHLITPFGTLLHEAIRVGNFDIVKLLVESGIDVNRADNSNTGGALYLAARNGHLNIVRYLLDHGAEMNTRERTSNPLFGAILDDRADIAQLLLDKGIDSRVKYKGKFKDAMDYAKEWGAVKIIKLLKNKAKHQPSRK